MTVPTDKPERCPTCGVSEPTIIGRVATGGQYECCGRPHAQWCRDKFHDAKPADKVREEIERVEKQYPALSPWQGFQAMKRIAVDLANQVDRLEEIHGERGNNYDVMEADRNRLAEQVEALQAELAVRTSERDIFQGQRDKVEAKVEALQQSQRDLRDSLCQEVHACLTTRGLWAPRDIHNGPDLIMAVAQALEKVETLQAEDYVRGLYERAEAAEAKVEALQAAWRDVRGLVPQYADVDLYPDGLRHGIRQLAAMFDNEKVLRERDKAKVEALTKERDEAREYARAVAPRDVLLPWEPKVVKP